MFKRTWIVILGALALGMLLSACGGSELAEDLTPIPTLPQGEEPELVEALQVTPEPVAGAGSEAELSQDELVALGAETFGQCAGCHGAADGAGPALPGMGERAATRVEGMSAEEYLHEAIVDPGAYVVDGFSNIMPSDYGEKLSEQEVQGLVAYILAESGGDDVATDEEPVDDQSAEEDDSADEDAAEEPSEAAVEGDAENGKTLFADACAVCHGAETGAGPSLPSIVEDAADRVDGQSAEEYLHESIVDPGAYVVDGFANIMPPTYSEKYSEQELQDIIAYILSQ